MEGENRRIAKWDNVKFWMILCVVIGHVLYCFRGNDLAFDIYVFVYSFHMPVLIFVAGMFSRHTVESRNYGTVINYVAVYLIMKALEQVSGYIISGKIHFYFLWESGPAWFGLAMAVFILITMFVSKYDMKYVMAVALLAGCFAVLDSHFGDHFASMRIMVFYPVFLAGFYSRPEMFDFSSYGRPFRVLIHIASFIAIASVGCIMFLLSREQLSVILKLFKGKYAYDEMHLGIESVGYRLACYAFWALIIIAVIVTVGNHETWLTWIGSRSMSIFIWHSFVIDLLIKKAGIGELMMREMPDFYIIAAIATAVIITVVTAYLPDFRLAKKLGKA